MNTLLFRAVVAILMVTLTVDRIAAEDASSPSIDASLIQLLANPTRFEGKRVRVVAYANIDADGKASIYISPEAARNRWRPDGVGLVLPSGLERFLDLHQSWLLIEGVFVEGGPKDHFHSYIQDISELRDFLCNCSAVLP